MVQRGRFNGIRMRDDDFPDGHNGLYEACNEGGCTEPISTTCGCGKRFCRRHIKPHYKKTHRATGRS